MATILVAMLLICGTPVLAQASLPSVYIGGQSIGVLLPTEGVTIVGISPVIEENGISTNPAEDSGLMVGDFITSINGVCVQTNAQISEVIEQAGKLGTSCKVEYQRNGIPHHTEIIPHFCTESQSWRIGLYVRDNTAGVGTLTFWDSQSLLFGALGHTISDMNTSLAPDNTGTVIRASIRSIRIGTKGSPGEKLGVFVEEGWQGDIRTNGRFGIYGTIENLPNEGCEFLPIAETSEIEDGAAEVYTVIEDETIEKFSVRVTAIANELTLGRTGMIVEITDETLLSRTGGIVQGMSGSPIVQNGKLIGAISHVFVNDPTSGYACYAQQMYEEAIKSIQ